MSRLALLLLLAAGLLLAVLRGPRLLLGKWPAGAQPIDEAALRALWEPGTTCLTASAFEDELSGVLHPAADSDYAAGLAALTAGDVNTAETHLQQAVAHNGHPLALVLLANIHSSTTGKRPGEYTIYAGTWTDTMRLDLARYYFWLSNHCTVAQLPEAAWRYVDWGAAYLPTGGIAELELPLARQVGQIYFADEQWELALPWLQHASQANDSALILLAETYVHLGRYEPAVESYERALRYYPDHVRTRLGAVQAASAAGRPELALAWLQETAGWETLGIEGLLLWAELCARQGDTACARQQYERILTLDAENETAINGLQQIENGDQ